MTCDGELILCILPIAELCQQIRTSTASNQNNCHPTFFAAVAVDEVWIRIEHVVSSWG